MADMAQLFYPENTKQVVAASCCGDVSHQRGLGNLSVLEEIKVEPSKEILQDIPKDFRQLRPGWKVSFHYDSEQTFKGTLKNFLRKY